MFGSTWLRESVAHEDYSKGVYTAMGMLLKTRAEKQKNLVTNFTDGGASVTTD